MKITWLGHSAFRIETKKSVILIDPFLTGNSQFEGQDRAKAIAGTTHILITHGHGDHIGDASEIAKETGAMIIANYDLAQWLMHHKNVENIDMYGPGGTVMHSDFSATLVHARHGSSFITEDGVSHEVGTAAGIVLHIENEPTLLHMGDTDIFSDMALIHELHQPEIGIVPIGDRFTMGGAVAALACRRYYKFKTIIPCHYGAFPILDQSADKFISAMEEDAKKVCITPVGEVLEV